MEKHKKSIIIICLIVVTMLITWNCYSPKEYPVILEEDLEQLIIITSNKEIDSALLHVITEWDGDREIRWYSDSITQEQ